ncbi:MAG: hypothetical protein JXA77_11430, partial [Bacteroidales bacterium]|nr:hypothetical protein [Bacteroidales bacterium]
SDRENEIIEVAEFIGIKSFKAKGKRLTNYQVDNIKEIEPVVKDETDQKPTLVYESSEDEKTKPFDDIPFETLSKREKWYMQADVVLNFDHDLEIEEIVKVLE